jgi:arylsulfatase A-like enzyme
MQRRTLLISLVILLLLASASYYLILTLGRDPVPEPSGGRLNVLMIVSDALRWDVLDCYGGEAVTPNIDRLAESGVLFENAYSTSPWTAPSAVSMFTGNYATTYGFAQLINTVQIYIPQSKILLAEFLHEHGYVTKMLIENEQASIHGNLQGFEALPDVRQFEEAVPAGIRERIESVTGTILSGSPAYKNSLIFLSHMFNMPDTANFFTLHWMEDPHCPYSPVDKFKSRINVDPAKLSNPMDHYARCIKETPKVTSREKKYIKDLYIAEVESVDERIGFAFDVLEQKKLIDNTIIIFTSDHGELFGEHGRYGHGWFGHDCHYYEHLIRVPLIIAGGNLPKGARIKSKLSLLDLMPTIKDILGAEYEDDMQGESFKSLLFNNSAANRVVYFDDVREHDQVDALIDEPYKLICLEGDKYQLYDLSIDASEENDIAASHPELAESIYYKILKLRKENDIRRTKNEAVFDTSTDIIDVNKKKMIEKLRSLGYIE